MDVGIRDALGMPNRRPGHFRHFGSEVRHEEEASSSDLDVRLFVHEPCERHTRQGIDAFPKVRMHCPSNVVDIHIYRERLRHLGQYPLTICVDALFLRVQCPTTDSTTTPAEKLAPVVHGICRSHWHAHDQRNLADDVRSLLVVELKPSAALGIQLVGGHLSIVSM